MAVRKLKGSWWVDFQYDQERLRKRSPENTRAGAEAFEAQVRHLIVQHGNIKAALESMAPKPEVIMPTFAEFSQRWLTTYVPSHSRPCERRQKEAALRNHLLKHFGKLPLDEVTTEKIDCFIGTLLKSGLKQKSVNNLLCVLSGCLRVAREWGVLREKPIIHFGRVREQPYHYLEDREVEALLAVAADTPWYLFILTCLQTGMRFSEMIALRWGDINLERRGVTVQTSNVEGEEDATKNWTLRWIPLGRELVRLLLPLAGPRTSLVFTRPDGRAISYRTAWQNLDQLCRVAGITHTGWHDLRHTFATRLGLAGVPLNIIQKLLGHADLKTTLRYVHLNENALRSAVQTINPDAAWQPVSTWRQPEVEFPIQRPIEVNLHEPRSWLHVAEKTALTGSLS